MKRYQDLSHDELIALGEAGVQRFIDIECAHAGIVPVTKPETFQLEKESLKKSDVFYEVGSVDFCPYWPWELDWSVGAFFFSTLTVDNILCQPKFQRSVN